jgi:putative RNA 2'-phosphotransferase
MNIPGLVRPPMAAPVHLCGQHGYHEGGVCPACGNAGTQIASGERRERLSRFLSGALRHFPEDAEIELDAGGWTDVDALADAVVRKYDWARPDHLDAVLATDAKGRFERRGDRVRAAYGHSIEVDLDATDDPIPEILYHGTAPRNLDAIRREGLRPMGRQRVHLSETVEAAIEVGSRHTAEPVVLTVDAAGMLSDGREIHKRGEETYTTDRVPPEYLAVRDVADGGAMGGA